MKFSMSAKELKISGTWPALGEIGLLVSCACYVFNISPPIVFPPVPVSRVVVAWAGLQGRTITHVIVVDSSQCLPLQILSPFQIVLLWHFYDNTYRII